MQSATKTFLFGPVYGRTQLRDILSSVYIRVSNITAVWTFKQFAVSITDMLTCIASFRGVSGRNSNETDSCKSRFIFQKGSELIETPGVVLSSLRFPDFRSIVNAGQVFYSNAFVLPYSHAHNLFCNSVIYVGGKSRFSAFKPFQKFSAAFCAFALNRFSNLKSFVSYFIKLFRTEKSSVRKSGYIGYSEIHADKFFNVFNIDFRNVYRLKQIELVFFVHQVCLTFDIWKVFGIVAHERHSFSSCNSPDGNGRFFVGEYSGVISDASNEIENSFLFPVKFIGIGNFTDTAYNYLSRKIKSVFDKSVCDVVNFELIENVILPGYAGDIVAGFITLFESLKQQLCLFFRRKEFHFQRQFHGSIIVHMFEKVKKGEAIPLPPKGGGLLAEIL